MIPKQDIIDGLPIRWAFHKWLTGGQWKFNEWRECLLSFNQRGYEIVYEVFNDERFMLDTRHFLEAHNAMTLTGFIKLWLKSCKEYQQLLND